jgi:F-type H+-transporting ATPase subunit a
LNNPKHILAHLIPQRTPPILIPVIVLIETARNLIRPATLAIRLTANITAGHLLITLLGNQVANNENIFIEPFIVATPILLLTLEFTVALIQSYVFAVLVTLYSREISYDN